MHWHKSLPLSPMSLRWGYLAMDRRLFSDFAMHQLRRRERKRLLPKTCADIYFLILFQSHHITVVRGRANPSTLCLSCSKAGKTRILTRA
jgi:hypothetical protein